MKENSIYNVSEFDKNEIENLSNLFHKVWGGDLLKFKHKVNWSLKNPGGKVLIMKDQQKTINARCSIKWPLKYNETTIKTHQFYDTCVHPDYRRKGFFSEINKHLVAELAESGINLIFNVSVETARKAYEKLGWSYIIGFRRLTLFNKPCKFINQKIKRSVHVQNNNIEYKKMDFRDLEKFIDSRSIQFKNLIHTKYDLSFLKWRLSNRLENYHLYKTDDVLIVYKINYNLNLKELIIGDFFLIENTFKLFKNTLKALIKDINPDITYTYIFNSHPYYNYYLKCFLLPNPFNYNLNFGTNFLDNKSKEQFKQKKWGISYLDIDTF